MTHEQRDRSGKRWRARVACLWVASAAGFVVDRPVQAAQTDVTISMATPAATPKVVGATVFASKPGSPLIFTVAATGQAPLAFSASSLPAGVTLSATGTLSGTTPAAGSYPIVVTVANSAGTAQATITLLAQNTLAATPVMGWNSYDSFGATVTESEVMAAAQAQKTTLLSAGYRYVVVDYLWFDPADTLDANGRFLPSISRFPSATGSTGFTSLAERVHALGLGFGIHIMRGIPRAAVTANAPILNSTYHARDAANTSDACPWDSHMWGVNGATAAGQAWYDSILAQYASWNIDFIKVDDMLNPDVSPLVYHQAEVDAIRRSIDKLQRSIVLSLSPGPMQTSNAANLVTNANQWRMVNDFWDVKGLSTLPDVISASVKWQAVPGLGSGHWPDADMLPLGYLGPRCPVHSSGPSALSHNQQVTVMTLWGILPSPLIFGGNVPMLASDAWTTALLTNDEVIAVNQDRAATEAKLLSQTGSQQVWSRNLSGGRLAVAFLNTGNQDASISVSFASLGVSAQSTVRDAWHRSDLTVSGNGPSVVVPHDAAALLVLSPPQAEAADAGATDSSDVAAADSSQGSEGTSGSGGVDDAGAGLEDSGGSGPGAPNDASGASGTATNGGDAGAPAAASGSANDNTSSDASAGGSFADAAQGVATGASPSTSSAGCSCRVASHDVRSDERSLLVLAAVAAFVARARRRSKRARRSPAPT